MFIYLSTLKRVMPFAVTHVILTVVLIDLFRDYVIKSHKKYLTLHTLMVAGVASLLPDIDMVVEEVLKFFGYSFEIVQHGGITHSAFFGLIFLIPAFIFLRKEKYKVSTYFFVIAFGILFHIFLDYFLGTGRFEGVMWLWPLSTYSYKLYLLPEESFRIFLALDAIILLGWLWHEEVKHKIRDFI